MKYFMCMFPAAVGEMPCQYQLTWRRFFSNESEDIVERTGFRRKIENDLKTRTARGPLREVLDVDDATAEEFAARAGVTMPSAVTRRAC